VITAPANRTEKKVPRTEPETPSTVLDHALDRLIAFFASLRLTAE